MINKKKISEAASYHLYDVRAAYADQEIGSYAYPTDIRDIEQQIRDDFKAGANWALQEFKKSLWHDASEEPKPTKLILCQRKTGYTHYMLDKKREEFQWDRMVYNFDIVKWCYVDDILPKEGGEE